MDPNEIDAEIVIQILRQELEAARWTNVMLRAKLTQLERPQTPVETP